MFSTILLKCCASKLNQSFMLGRLGAGGRGPIDQEQAGVRPARNQAAVLGLRRQILRSRPQAARSVRAAARTAEPKRANGKRERRRPPRRSRRRAAAPPAPSRPIGREWSREQAEAIDKVGRWLKAGEPQVFRLFGYAGRRQDDARPPHRGRRARRDGLRRLHRQGRAGDALQGLRRRDHHPRAHLPGERGRGRRADLHPQRRRARLPRRAHRDRRMLDGRRRARRATSSRSASRSWCWAIRSSCRRSRAAAISPTARRT